jgi:hypothetical protein
MNPWLVMIMVHAQRTQIMAMMWPQWKSNVGKCTRAPATYSPGAAG